MIGILLARGMLIGILAGVFAFGVATLIGEPSVDRAIAFESAHGHDHPEGGRQDETVPHEHAAPEHAGPDVGHHHHHAAEAGDEEEELFSRATQGGWGLLTGLVVYGAAVGGLFALTYAYAQGRMGALGPRGLAATLAVLGFLAIVLVPGFKYPANPPAVGDPDTIRQRTALFFILLILSVAAMGGAVVCARRLAGRWGGWNAGLAGGALFLAVMVAAGFVLPTVDEVPVTFPAQLLWQFRLASWGIQAALWAALGLGFGGLCQAAQERDAQALRRGDRPALF
ncbi:CbtA family protein [Nitrospirillum iridis]|uniref:ABC-type nickel/cobalt efflux system permease component RcnA n=1 Tax=Nitrospirillum iridis TaxID=765888 RepID=A0A7X0B100_9PROT|nr:CbtA family protein [Nitrospirillum iridis]MBB6253789.1 ABC-type nickel/cobalt efflux system permease component RcnA [Nitrospirillum iridis]